MPDGSSSDAPVTKPGPSVFQYSSASLNGFLFARIFSSFWMNSTPSSRILAGSSKTFSSRFSLFWGCSMYIQYIAPFCKTYINRYNGCMLSRYTTRQGLAWIDLESPTREEVSSLSEELNLHPVISQEL